MIIFELLNIALTFSLIKIASESGFFQGFHLIAAMIFLQIISLDNKVLLDEKN